MGEDRPAVTCTGRALAAGAVSVAVVGVLLDHPEVAALGLAGVALVLAALAWGTRRSEVVAVRTVAPAEVIEGTPAQARITITNTGTRRTAQMVATDRLADRELQVTVPSLPPGATFVTTYPVPTDRRGRFGVGPLELHESDPAGLVHVLRVRVPSAVLAVYPRAHDVVPVPTGAAADIDGPTQATSPQGGVAFHSLREYVPGDDLRLVHWLSTARSGTVMMRHNVVASEPLVTVLLDTAESSYAGDGFEEAVRMAASWCRAAAFAGYPLELRTTGGDVVSPSSGGVVAAVSAALADVTATASDPGLAALGSPRLAIAGGALGVVSGAASDVSHRSLAWARHRFDVVSVAMVQGVIAVERPYPGVLVVGGPTSADLAAVWNRSADR